MGDELGDDDFAGLFDDDDGDSVGTPEESDADITKKRKRALETARSQELREKKRLTCNCYVSRYIKRLHAHLADVEASAEKLRQAGVKTSNKPRLADLERVLKSIQTALSDLKRAVAGDMERSSQLAMKVAIIESKRHEINVIKRDGIATQVTSHSAFDSLKFKPKPKARVAK